MLRPLLLTILTLNQATGNFNFFVDKQEFHRITGATLSQVYLVRDGVVNEYALGHVMNVPFHIQYLDFKWQATGKKPVHYELDMEFSDFFALLQPSANISKVGRLPFRLETFRVHLPCSGRLTTEVPVTIRFTFNVKQGKNNNATEVKVKRNKICLLRDQTTTVTTPTTAPIPFTPPPPEPSLFLASLLGACAVSASLVSILFFICLKKRLEKVEDTSPSNTIASSYETYYEESPVCLIRKWKEGSLPPPPPSSTYLHTKGSDVSPYAYAQIVPRAPSDWGDSSGTHIYANQLQDEYYGGRSTCSSLVQIDGFQCGRNFVKEQGNIVERFL